MPAVQTYWEQLDLSSVSPEVIDQLILGKYYYDRRQPGNFGLAIDHWKKALALLGPKGNVVQKLLASAEKELAMQFSSDSADALVLLKQGKRDQAVALLEKMRADYLDVDSPQYTWASLVLHRRRR